MPPEFHRRPLSRAGSALGFLRLLFLLGDFLDGLLRGFLGRLLGFLRRFLRGLLGLLRHHFRGGFLRRLLHLLGGFPRFLDHGHGGLFGGFGGGADSLRHVFQNRFVVVHIVPQCLTVVI